MRSPAGGRRQAGKAWAAISAARATSSAGESGTSARIRAEAGSRTGKVAAACEVVHAPPMKLGRRSIIGNSFGVVVGQDGILRATQRVPLQPAPQGSKRSEI